MFRLFSILTFLIIISCTRTTPTNSSSQKDGSTHSRFPTTETDNFTNRYTSNLLESLDILNRHTNKRIQEAIDNANAYQIAKKATSCEVMDYDALYYYIDKKIGNKTWAELEKDIEKMDEFSKITFRGDPYNYQFKGNRFGTVYKNIHGKLTGKFWPYVTLDGFGGIGSSIKLNGHIIGTDKIGHFTGLGYVYFTKFLAKYKALVNKKMIIQPKWKTWLREVRKGKLSENDKRFLAKSDFFIAPKRAVEIAGMTALKYGEETEIGVFGLQTTGIYSYGDLVANYLGMIWWLKVAKDPRLDKRAILHLGIKPKEYMIHCNGGRWSLNRPIDWKEYADADMDEGVNCNRYHEDYESSVKDAIRDLQEKGGGKRYICPTLPKECKRLKKKYVKTPFGDLTDHLIGPECQLVR